MSVYYTDFTIEMDAEEMLQTAMKDSTPKRYARLLLEGAEIIRQLRKERDEARAPGWIRPEERLPEPLTSVIVCRPARAKGDPLTVDMGYLRPDGTWRVLGTPLNRIRGWMPAPAPMEEDE